MKTFTLVLLLNSWSTSGRGAIDTVDGFTSLESCQAAGEVFNNRQWDQYYYCLEVK